VIFVGMDLVIVIVAAGHNTVLIAGSPAHTIVMSTLRPLGCTVLSLAIGKDKLRSMSGVAQHLLIEHVLQVQVTVL